mmetsp:Transcript_106394/g.307905  ORF Transcript_106394/g.307905 Transcript_106394/m.307905 type:complete len:331 (-) Transcript_106394:124-1116(-)|eukprot:CAMPEP_0176050618 /NCGR_PEP_ID=MMETSP0120_2-20121206/25160_1 /TAXON_ID=160619 /ORGANISM="Kryptoperidinium foliaceum, Strain CCMP 1326" /LENGTH=330 /DNA_ID=CAMNT_0017384053 /DNA_START=115 /DNA_END=1107 /DNA_ORIENTATION=+
MTPEFSSNDASMQSNDWSESQQEDDYDKSIAKGGVTTPFPWKLHDMLDAMDREGDHSVVQWQPHGRAFMVHDPKKFVQAIMPHYFNQTKYASFQRQLNLYGFNRLSHGKDKGAYYHVCFVRGQRNLCRNMVRQKIKGTKVRRSLSPEEEPNFYLPDWEQRLATAFSVQPPKSPTTPSTPKSKVAKTKASKSSKKQIPHPPSDSLVSMMRETSKHSAPSLLPPPPVLKHLNQQPSVAHSNTVDLFNASPPQSSQSGVRGGDLLFFEGQPFRYLDHMDELPPISSQDEAVLHGASLDPYSNSYKQTLHNMINSIVMDSTQQLQENQHGVCSV